MKRARANWWVIARDRAPKLAAQAYSGITVTSVMVVEVGVEAARIVGRAWRKQRLNWPGGVVEG